MSISIGVFSEHDAEERRVALDPEAAGTLASKGYDVRVEAGAGKSAFFADGLYEEKGCVITGREEVRAADIIPMVRPPSASFAKANLRRGVIVAGFMQPLEAPERARQLAEEGVTAISMELVPRISRAQTMDALSAMSAIAGYRSVLVAAQHLPKFFPLLTTAAGTVRPANVLVLGAGVAGLQAIATARRLGARVSAYDIREAANEEVQSLGAKFVELEVEVDDMQDAGGYAKALAEEKQKQQTKLLVPYISRSDVVITTALIPGRQAPILVTEEAVRAMEPGSVIVDLAAPNGGNCAHTEPGQTIEHGGVTICGPVNLPSEMPIPASQMFARTVSAMITSFATPDALTIDLEDEVLGAACIAHDGKVVNERVRKLLDDDLRLSANDPFE